MSLAVVPLYLRDGVRIDKPLVNTSPGFVFSLWFWPYCCGGSTSSSVFSSCALISRRPDLLREASVGMPPV